MTTASQSNNKYQRSPKARNMSRTRFPKRSSRGIAPQRALDAAMDNRPKGRKTRSNPVASLFLFSLIIGLAIFAFTLGGFGRTAHSATLSNNTAPIALENATFIFNPVEIISLRDGHSINSMEIRLGHLFTGLSPEKSEIIVAHANQAGEVLTYNYHHLNIIATRYGINWQAFSEADHVQITRASNEISLEEIEDTIRTALINEGADANFDMQFTSAASILHLPTNILPSLTVERLDFDATRGQFSATLRAPAEGPALTRTAISGRIYTLVQVPVLSERMRSGEVITQRDIIWEEHRRDNISSNTLLDADELLDMTPRHSINASTLIRENDLIEPILIARSDIITMTLNTGRISLTAQGRALNSGAMGETIRVTNLSSNRTIEATVTGLGSAVVR